MTKSKELQAEKIIREWNDGIDRDVLFIEELKLSGFNLEQIATIIGLIDATCHHCWDASSRCQCWNDE